MKKTENTPFHGLMEALKKDPQYGPLLKETEETEKEVQEALECVDLDIAYSPVILHAGQREEEAVEIDYLGENGKYVITKPTLVQLTPEETKIARCRYLITRGRKRAPQIEALFKKIAGE